MDFDADLAKDTSYSSPVKSDLANWRPEGRIMFTLYEHTNPVHSILNLGENKFITIAEKFEANLWIAVSNGHSDLDIERQKLKKIIDCDKAASAGDNRILLAGKNSLQMIRVLT